MSLKVYEWVLSSKKTIIRQGILCAESKASAEMYLLKSLTDDEKSMFKTNILKVHQLKI